MNIPIDQAVIDFISRAAAVKPERISPNSTLCGDLGIDGADGWELMEQFSKEFNVDLTGFDSNKNFSAEGCFPPLTLLFLLRDILFSDSRKVGGARPLPVRFPILAAQRKCWQEPME